MSGTTNEGDEGEGAGVEGDEGGADVPSVFCDGADWRVMRVGCDIRVTMDSAGVPRVPNMLKFALPANDRI